MSTLPQQPPPPEQVNKFIQDLLPLERRENAMAELSRNRELIPELGILLWNTPGAVSALLQEVLFVYPVIFPPTMSSSQSTRVCNALALMQCVASNDETRPLFIKAQLPMYLYPFLNTSTRSRAFEFLRLTTLGVVGALVKNDSSEVIDYLLSTDIIPLCLKITENGNELSKTVAIFIVQKILMDNLGLAYVCQTESRIRSIIDQLDAMLSSSSEPPTLRLFKHIIRCYLRISDDPKGLEEIRKHSHAALKSQVMAELVKEDPVSIKFYSELLNRIKN